MEYLGIAEIAKIHSVSKVTVWTWIKTGKLKAECYKQGLKNRFKIKAEDLKEFQIKYFGKEF